MAAGNKQKTDEGHEGLRTVKGCATMTNSTEQRVKQIFKENGSKIQPFGSLYSILTTYNVLILRTRRSFEFEMFDFVPSN